jgi:hypothetical protein
MEQGALRPMGVGDILDAAFGLYRSNFPLFVGIVAALHIPFAVISYFLRDITLGSSNLILFVVVNPLVTGALVFSVARRFLNQDVTIRSAYSHVRFTSILGASFFIAMVIGFSVIVMFGISLALKGFMAGSFLFLPLIYLLVRWSLYPQAIMVEGFRAISALGRSSDLVKGSWWRVFFVTALLYLMVSIIRVIPMAIIFLRARSFQTGDIISLTIDTIFNILLNPIFMIGQTVLYFDLRIRKEAFDIEVLSENLKRLMPAA